MTAVMHTQSPSMTASYFPQHDKLNLGRHMAYDSIFKPPARTPRRPHTHRTQSNRSTTSIPRPVSKLDHEPGSVRKRPRLNGHSYSSTSQSSLTPQTTPHNQTYHGYFDQDAESDYGSARYNIHDSTHSRDIASPPPFINTSYRLAGGLDTPNASYEKRLELWGEEEEEKDWRMNRYTSTSVDNELDRSLSTSYATALGSSSNTQPRAHLPRTPSSGSKQGHKRSLEDRTPPFATPAESQSESQLQYTLSGWHIRSRAWAMTGGLAFKAINFCLNTAFSGFSAGGGQSYAMDIGTPEVPHRGFRVSQVAESEDVFSSQYEKQDEVPGGFPHDYMTGSRTSGLDMSSSFGRDISTPTWQGQGSFEVMELRNDWMLVDRPTNDDNSFSSGRQVTRKKSRASIAGSRNNSYKGTNASRPSVASTTGASFASPRARSSSSLQHKRSASALSVKYERETGSERPSLARNSPHGRQSSHFSAGSIPSGAKCASPSALSPEITEYKRRIRRKTRAEDESMARMNAHLQDMIRQGKEALGSRISIECDESDDGYL